MPRIVITSYKCRCCRSSFPKEDMIIIGKAKACKPCYEDRVKIRITAKHRHCACCQNRKPIDEYDRAASGNLSNVCRECKKEPKRGISGSKYFPSKTAIETRWHLLEDLSQFNLDESFLMGK